MRDQPGTAPLLEVRGLAMHFPITEGMVLSRTVYAENLPLVRAGTTLNSRSLEKVRSAAEMIGFTDVWIHGVVDSNPVTLPGVSVA